MRRQVGRAIGRGIVSPVVEGMDVNAILQQIDVQELLENQVDIIIDNQIDPGFKVSTILDFTTDEPEVVRQGLGWQEVENWINVVH